MNDVPGIPPFGATVDGQGVTFALYSHEAEKVELCLFDEAGKREIRRHPLSQRTGDVWHDWIPRIRPGQKYGYRVHGLYRPAEGLRFNPYKLLIDPYARALTGRLTWNDALFAYEVGHPDGPLSFDTRDSAPYVPKCTVTGPGPSGERPHRPATPMHDSVIYELHAKGMTQLHPDVPQKQRGTVMGLCHPTVIAHLKKIGVTAIELLPVHAWIDEWPITQRGLVNYWGYNTLSFFCADEAHLAAGGIDGFARMVDTFHDAGIEVILDVVYNHTAEGNGMGPTLSFRGIDNRTYYRLSPDDRHVDMNYTGCGNTLNAADPVAARLIMDSLRYWAEAGGVDGFRFDLASALARDAAGGYEQRSPLLAMIEHDPLLSGLKLIAEPWDATMEGHRLGTFPSHWSEWNDAYRNTVRRFWSGEGGLTGELATRISGSSDIFGPAARRPSASINFATAHDGFSLHDLVFYANKHNEANGEDNRDGDNQNYSFGLGEEDDGDPATAALIRRQKRNVMATLVLSRGVPMLRAGDEVSHTQNGNNNAYCQDNETSWIDWSALGDDARNMTEFLAALTGLRKDHPVLATDHYLEYPEWEGNGYHVTWLAPEGRAVMPDDWHRPDARLLACMLYEEATGDRLLMVLNAADHAIPFNLPDTFGGWRPMLDTATETGLPTPNTPPARGAIEIAPQSMTVLGTDPDLETLKVRAEDRGVALGYHDVHGAWHQASAETLTAILDAMGPEPQKATRPGHSLPQVSCYLPRPLRDGRHLWGLTVQLYGLRSERNWGIGDFRDLRTLINLVTAIDCAAIQVNPLHALFPWWPDHVSPYAPSSRLFLNPLYIAIDDIPEYDESPEAREIAAGFEVDLRRMRQTKLVDYVGVAHCKGAVLEALYRHFHDTHQKENTARAQAFAAFRNTHGAVLRDFATFEVLGGQFATDGRGNWRDWPEEYRDPGSSAVHDFAAKYADDIAYRAWLQWIAMEQVEAVGRLARERMAIGLIADIAIGAAAAGADTWSGGNLVARGVEIGAPPDPFNALGQSWGAPPWRPDMLKERDYAPFRAMLRAAMSWAGGVRLDHVIGFERQFWVPDGMTGRDGAYVTYPREALIAAIAEESNRHDCLVIGEDLGTVPEGFRDRIHAANILSTKVLYFERTDEGGYRRPVDFPYLSSATASTHDLPTLVGYGRMRDIEARAPMGYYEDPDAETAARETREHDFHALIAALREAGILPDKAPSSSAFCDGVHRFLATAGSALALAQFEDVLGVADQANLPGTVDEYPNWRRTYPRTLAEIETDDTLAALAGPFEKRRFKIGRHKD